MSNESCRVITKAQWDEYQELKKRFDEDNNVSNKKVRWKPKDGDVYWIIIGTGVVDWETWFGSKCDIDCYKFHNCFQTEEEAQKELDRRRAEQELLDMCDWDDEMDLVWSIVYSSCDNCFVIGCYSTIMTSPYRFASEESAKIAFNTLGREKLKLIFKLD